MTREAFFENVNTAALILGYPALIIFVATLLWVAAVVIREVFRIIRASQYERWQRDREMRDWENIESSWALELDPENHITKYDTDRFEFPIPGLSDEQVYDQLKEQ
jgi:hypothetical protein